MPQSSSSGFFKRPGAPALYYQLNACGDAKGLVGLIHGFAEHSGRYDDLVRKLAAAGFSCLRYDLRGHGRSEGKPADVERFDDYVTDHQALREYLRQQKLIPACALHLIAHSMGGLIALESASRHAEWVASLVLTSPCLSVTLSAPLKWAARVIAIFAPGFYFSQPVAAGQLSHDAAKVREYLADPLIPKKISARLLAALMQEGEYLVEKPLTLAAPVLMLLAGSDRIVNNAPALSLYERLKAPQKKIFVLEWFLQVVF